ncbi:MAG TPA: CoA transferase [Candidatus Binataceae bacterium]|nr:CoA transferase [Candidatus Binataceae bacterium]
MAGISAVECGQGVAAAYGAKLLAMLGADVIKVEPPGGDLTRNRGPYFGDAADINQSGLFLYLNADKKGVTLDLADRGERARLDTLLARADILIHNIAPRDRLSVGMDNAAVSQTHPALTVAGISPFGDYGPYAHYHAYEISAAHASGMASLAPAVSQFPDRPPLKLFGHQAEFQAGAFAAMASLAAWLYWAQTGIGQAIEVSEQECLATMLEGAIPIFSYTGRSPSRLGHHTYGPRSIWPTRDGWIFINPGEEEQWQRLVELMGNPEWANEEIFKDRFIRGKYADALWPLMAEWTKDWNKQELFMAAQARRIPLAPMNRPSDVYADVHLRARNFFGPLPTPGGRTIEIPTLPFKSTGSAWRIERPAPALGEHNDEVLAASRTAAASAHDRVEKDAGTAAGATGRGPLAGVRVLDFGWIWAAPYCSMMLAHLGADVIRVETAKRTCLSRRNPPFADNQPGPNRAGVFNEWNQNKRSIQLNLAKPEGIELALRLAEHSDITIENFGAGVLDRMGLGYEAMRRRNPGIIMLSIGCYGRTGPYTDFVNYGPQVNGQAGLLAVSGYEGDQIREGPCAYGDPATGVFAAFLINAAMIQRRHTGLGQYFELSMMEVLAMGLPEALLEYAMNGRDLGPSGNRDRNMAPHNCYKALGGPEEWVTIAVGTEDEWLRFCKAIGQPALADDPRFATAPMRKRNEDELDRIITQWTGARDRWDAARMLQDAGIAAIPTLTLKDLFKDPHLRERNFFVNLPHPEVGAKAHSGVPWKMSLTPCEVVRPSPCLGANTDDVLSSLLGLSADEIDQLRHDEVLL